MNSRFLENSYSAFSLGSPYLRSLILCRKFHVSKPTFRIPFAETCNCDFSVSDTLPSDLDIDRTSVLAGNITRHHRSLLICTGRNDWNTRIELEPQSLAAKIKTLIGRGGKYCDPFNNIMVGNISLPIEPLPTDLQGLEPYSPSTQSESTKYSSAYIMGLDGYIPYIPHKEDQLVESFVRGYLLPETHEQEHLAMHLQSRRYFRSQVSRKLKVMSNTERHTIGLVPPPDRDMLAEESVLIMICGHGERDRRCGILGPLIEAALKANLRSMGLLRESCPSPIPFRVYDKLESAGGRSSHGYAKQEYKTVVGMISHIGGHKFAGNLIIYLPRNHILSRQINKCHGQSEMKGTEVWYGRVRPEHAKGIIEQTLLQGKVIRELLRGIVDGKGNLVTSI